MKVEELLSLLQERGLSDDEIKALLHETLDALEKDFEEHDEAEQASKLLGVDLGGNE